MKKKKNTYIYIKELSWHPRQTSFFFPLIPSLLGIFHVIAFYSCSSPTMKYEAEGIDLQRAVSLHARKIQWLFLSFSLGVAVGYCVNANGPPSCATHDQLFYITEYNEISFVHHHPMNRQMYRLYFHLNAHFIRQTIRK